MVSCAEPNVSIVEEPTESAEMENIEESEEESEEDSDFDDDQNSRKGGRLGRSKKGLSSGGPNCKVYMV